MNMHIQKVTIILLLLLSLSATAQAATMMINLSGTNDGYTAREGVTESYTAIRNSAGNAADGSGTLSMRLVSSSSGNLFTQSRRAYLQFDSSSIPDGATVTGVTVYVFGNSYTNQFAETPSFALYSFSPSSNGTIDAADHTQGGTTALSNSIAGTSLSTTGYNAFTLTDPTSVSKTSWTRFMIKNSWDAGNTSPTWEASKSLLVLFEASETAGTTKNPYMLVTYTSPPVTGQTLSSTYGYSPYEITFTDTSTESPTGWAWYYRNTGGGAITLFSTAQHPAHTFTDAGSYDLYHYASNAAGGDWENQTDRFTIYNLTTAVTSKSVTLTYDSANGITWWEYGLSATNLPFKTRNVTGTGAVTTTVSGLPLLSGTRYYFRACTVLPYECTDTSSIVLASTTPNPETTYGQLERNISDSQFNLTELGPSLFEPMGWVTGQSSSISVGIIMFFVMVAFWMRGRGVVIPIILGFIVSFLLISGAAYGTSIPPEFVLGGMIFASLGLTGITLMLFKR